MMAANDLTYQQLRAELNVDGTLRRPGKSMSQVHVALNSVHGRWKNSSFPLFRPARSRQGCGHRVTSCDL